MKNLCSNTSQFEPGGQYTPIYTGLLNGSFGSTKSRSSRLSYDEADRVPEADQDGLARYVFEPRVAQMSMKA